MSLMYETANVRRNTIQTTPRPITAVIDSAPFCLSFLHHHVPERLYLIVSSSVRNCVVSTFFLCDNAQACGLVISLHYNNKLALSENRRIEGENPLLYKYTRRKITPKRSPVENRKTMNSYILTRKTEYIKDELWSTHDFTTHLITRRHQEEESGSDLRSVVWKHPHSCTPDECARASHILRCDWKEEGDDHQE